MPEKAPWPDSTPEEDAAYALQAQMWDMEFESGVVSQGGPQLSKYVDADRAHLLGTSSYTAQGLYRPEGADSIMESSGYELLADELTAKGIEAPGPDTVAAVGAANATDQIWAHEFSHRRDSKEGRRGSERYNLIHDAFRSDTPFEWADAVSRWLSWNRERFTKDKEMNTYEDVENNLKEQIESSSYTLLDAEVEAREAEGDVPMKRDGWFNRETLLKDQREQMERRSQSWSIEKYNEIVKGWK